MPQVKYRNGYIGFASDAAAQALAVKGAVVILRPRPTGALHETPPEVLEKINADMQKFATVKEAPDA